MKNIISYGAYFLVFLANLVIFTSIFGIYKYFNSPEDSPLFW